jgi:rhodanese-related sulfurtransferase
MKKLIIILLSIVSLYSNQSKELLVDEVEAYFQNGATIIDIRDEYQWKKTGIIPGSYRLTYNDTKKENNEQKWLYTLIRLLKDKNGFFILISSDGEKAKQLSYKLKKDKKFINGLYLKDGMKAWTDADRKVINF